MAVRIGSGVLAGPRAVLQALLNARGQLFPWVAVFFGAGVGAWFALPFDPGAGHYAAVAGALALAALVWWRADELWHPPAVILLCLAAGFLATGLRAQLVEAPVLGFRYYGPVTGRIIEIDRSQSDALRLTLDQVVLDRTAPDRTPVKVRISAHGDGDLSWISPGQTVMTTAHLSAPEGPVEPGAFDFARMAWFEGLGAVGYAQSPVVLWDEAAAGTSLVNRLRAHLSRAMMAEMPSDAGAFATGSMTGDRSGISAETVAALRDSSLAHLLAISGMNMVFLVGFVFALVRYGLALVPPLALRVNSKKVAAWVSLGVAAFYLALSGANVATERAFIMVAVMLVAVLLDRKALSLRSVAISAVILLAVQPESLLSPGFQMSYAATVALIAGLGPVAALKERWNLPGWVMPAFMLVGSSVVAGAATAPYAAAHFNRFTDYGLVANLLTVPVMGAVVMPAGAVAALLALVGLAAPALWVMELGARWILFVAHQIAALEGSVTPILSPGPLVLPLITFAGAWAVLWQGWMRAGALVPGLLALALWAGTDRPALLISSDGRLAGLMGQEGRALSAAKGGGFSAENWLLNDGDLAAQEVAAARPGFTGEKGQRWFDLAGVQGVLLSGKAGLAALDGACATAALVILAEKLAEGQKAPTGCVVLDPARLKQTGALAVHPVAAGLRVVPARADARPWSGGEDPARPFVVSARGQ